MPRSSIGINCYLRAKANYSIISVWIRRGNSSLRNMLRWIRRNKNRNRYKTAIKRVKWEYLSKTSVSSRLRSS
jgi:hypothetical protein